jgi:hypothetical protein
MTGPEQAKRRTVNPIFGEILPMASSDERDEGSSAEDPERDGWLRDNVPPHHG